MPYVIPKGTRCKICRADMSDRWRSYSTRKRLVFQNYNRARYGEYLYSCGQVVDLGRCEVCGAGGVTSGFGSKSQAVGSVA